MLGRQFRSFTRSVWRRVRFSPPFFSSSARNTQPTWFAGEWKYLYRAVDREGDTVDFLLTAKRALAAARRFPVLQPGSLITKTLFGPSARLRQNRSPLVQANQFGMRQDVALHGLLQRRFVGNFQRITAAIIVRPDQYDLFSAYSTELAAIGIERAVFLESQLAMALEWSALKADRRAASAMKRHVLPSAQKSQPPQFA